MQTTVLEQQWNKNKNKNKTRNKIKYHFQDTHLKLSLAEKEKGFQHWPHSLLLIFLSIVFICALKLVYWGHTFFIIHILSKGRVLTTSAQCPNSTQRGPELSLPEHLPRPRRSRDDRLLLSSVWLPSPGPELSAWQCKLGGRLDGDTKARCTCWDGRPSLEALKNTIPVSLSSY